MISELKRRDCGVESVVCTTAQHREMLDQALSVFGIVPDIDLDLMEPDQDLDRVASRVLQSMTDVYTAEHPDLVVVQGDTTTTTAMAAALGAFYLRIPVAHVEGRLAIL